MGQLETQAYLTVGWPMLSSSSQCCAQMKIFCVSLKKKWLIFNDSSKILTKTKISPKTQNVGQSGPLELFFTHCLL